MGVRRDIGISILALFGLYLMKILFQTALYTLCALWIRQAVMESKKKKKEEKKKKDKKS